MSDEGGRGERDKGEGEGRRDRERGQRGGRMRGWLEIRMSERGWGIGRHLQECQNELPSHIKLESPYSHTIQPQLSQPM